LNVDRNGDVRDTAAGQSRAAGKPDHVLHMARSHDARIVDAYVHEKLVELDVLLGKRVEQIVELQARNGEHRLPIELGVVEAVEKVNATRPRRRETDAELTGPFGIGTGIEGGGLFVPNLDEADPILPGPQRFDDTVDSVSRDSKDGVDPPLQESLDEYVAGGRLSHGNTSGAESIVFAGSDNGEQLWEYAQRLNSERAATGLRSALRRKD
jgi:hypothetical protein